MTILESFALTGRVALVTGSSRGIGYALAKALGEAGAEVVLNGRNAEALEKAKASLEAELGRPVRAHACDVTSEAEVEAMVSAIEADTDGIEILVNNAGMQQRAPFLEFPLEGFRKLLDLNLIAPFVVAQAVGKHMAARGRGKIINIGSVQSELGRPTIVPYTATKGGLTLFTRGLCADLGPLGIQVNTLAPGYFATELTEALVNDEEFSAWVASRTPAGRWGDVAELGGAAVYLASDASSFVTGQTLFVDGGMTAVV
jgi:gluconate 5-dehydrogenase